MKRLPYRARTTTGDTFNIDFPLHRETGSAVRVSQLLSAVLDAVDRDIALAGETSNGDVLQAIAMALAIRARIIHAPLGSLDSLSTELLQAAQAAVAASKRHTPQIGHA